ncbi:MAG: peptidoglycan-binding protein [bacterium]|nr:peptidoglycan-binding protein [bacterium]
MQTGNRNTKERGSLRVEVASSVNQTPIAGAKVSISYVGEPNRVLEEVYTNSSGQTEELLLDAPPLSLSLEAGVIQPYSEYTIEVQAAGFAPEVVSGTEILSQTAARQAVRLTPLNEENAEGNDVIVIPAHTLYGDYPPKIAEPEIKAINESGEIVLSRVVVPETVIVHDGAPSDSTAKNYYVPYRDYIKNVASSEIYATWPQATIVANVLAIMSFTLNRVYTEWYRNKGYDFTITSSTAFDHKWIYGRNIFDSISMVVDEIFDNYLSRPEVKQPILTQYCDGRRVQCPKWMTQWGSCSLGEQGYSPIEILRYYYGDDMYINTADVISGIPSSWPGYELTIGSSGDKVRQMQNQLRAISAVYTAIPQIMADGIYGAETTKAVREFQSIFGLPQTGVVDFATWYRISHIYVAITRIAELN